MSVEGDRGRGRAQAAATLGRCPSPCPSAAALEDGDLAAARTALAQGDPRRGPGSIQKLVTAAAALRAGRDPDAEIKRMTCRGYQRYGRGWLADTWAAGPLEGGLAEALAASCNIAFANLAVSLGRERLRDE